MDEEKQFVQGIIKGEQRAFKAVFLDLYEALCNFCWRYTQSKAVSEDLVQEAFADLWDLRETLDHDSRLKVYLYQAVKNKAFDYLDHQKVVQQYQADHSQEQEEVVKRRSPGRTRPLLRRRAKPLLGCPVAPSRCMCCTGKMGLPTGRLPK